MTDFPQARANMVESQLRCNNVNDKRVLAAFLAVRREAFVPAQMRPFAYMDEDLRLRGLDPDRVLLEPMTQARLIQLAEIEPTDVVLDVNGATGYSAAILSRMADAVVALEADETLAAEATRVLAEEGFDNAAVVSGPLREGWKREAPYDAIVVNGAVEEVPDAWFDQLKPDGRLVCVVGTGQAGRLRVYRGGVRSDGVDAFNAAVPLLSGFEREEAFIF